MLPEVKPIFTRFSHRRARTVRDTAARVLPALVLAVCTCACTLSRAAGEAVSVPIRLQGVHIYVEITVNGKPGVFVLDTGASANVITPEAVARFGLAPGS